MPPDDEKNPPTADSTDQRIESKNDVPKPSKELKVSHWKFILLLGAILLFSLIASNFKEFLGG